jgi:hypothetical protein
MSFLQKNQAMWVFPKKNHEWLQKIVNEFNINPVTARF